MKTLFSTAGMTEGAKFRTWSEFLHDRIGPVEQVQVDDGPFEGLIQAADVGELRITRIAESALRTAVTPQTLRQREAGTVFALIQIAGASFSAQDGRDTLQRAGDIVVLGGRPNVHLSSREDQSYVLEIPVEKLERALGPTRVYTALPIEAESAAASLVTTYFRELVRVHDRLDPGTAARMSEIGIDLLIAGIAERLAREVPQSLHGTVVLQRAKAHVEAHLGDSALDPPRLAAAVGVSLRRLQELFHHQGRHISDWIWQRRLEVAAQRLADPATRHLPIGAVALGCGFSSQPHFSRRFREQYGMTPSEYRRAADPGREP